MVTHRTATPGRVGSNDGYGVDATFSFYQNVRIDTLPGAARRREGRHGRRSQLPRPLRLQRRSLWPAGRASRRRAELHPGDRLPAAHRHAAQLRAGALQPAADAAIRTCGSSRTRGASTTSPTTRTGSTRASSIGTFQTEFTNSDVAGIVSTPTHFERLVRPFDVAPGVRIPVGGYDFHTLQLSYTGGQQRQDLRRDRLRDGDVLRRRRAVDRRQRRAHADDAAHVARAEPVGQLRRSASGIFTATVVRTRATYTVTPRMFVSGIVQYNSTTRSVGSNLRLRWE